MTQCSGAGWMGWGKGESEVVSSGVKKEGVWMISL